MAGLCVGTDGRLYGTLGHPFTGITTDPGYLISITTNGLLSTNAFFGGTKGDNPISRLLLASDGMFYGMTAAGGLYGYGTLYQASTNGIITPLVHFTGTNGGYTGPNQPWLPALMQASDGNIYGSSRMRLRASALRHTRCCSAWSCRQLCPAPPPGRRRADLDLIYQRNLPAYLSGFPGLKQLDQSRLNHIGHRFHCKLHQYLYWLPEILPHSSCSIVAVPSAS
jgi:uncharacterized repeat protein (TIGR03803 family)